MQKEWDEKKHKEIQYIWLGVKNSGFLTKYRTIEYITEALKPRYFEYKKGFV